MTEEINKAVSGLSFEEAVKNLNTIVGRLESGDMPLGDSLRLFEEGTQLVRLCSSMLDEAEQKVTLLRKNLNGEPEETEYDMQQ